MIIHLGVADVPYAGNGSASTGDVAGYLETKYSVMGNFVNLHLPEIVQSVEISVSEALDSMMMGAPASLDPLGSAVQDIQQLFTTYLDDEEITGAGQGGVPTQAAIDGVRSTLKKKKEIKNIKRYKSRVRGSRRPSFIDTGLYRASFRVWVK